MKCYATSIAELDGKVYVAVEGSKGCCDPLVYDSRKDDWSALPKLPYSGFSLVAVCYKKQLLAIGGVSDDRICNKVFAWDENNNEWTTPYPDMPTARFHSSSISHRSTCTVIVAGGVTCSETFAKTGAVEVLYICAGSDSHWSVVKALPYVISEALPLIVGDTLYIAEGFDDNFESVCNVVTASLPELLQSNVKKTRSDKVWHKLPNMPYSTWSIVHYQGYLIIFNGDHKDEQSGNWELVQRGYIYNPNTESWNYIGDDFHDYELGKAVHLTENTIFFVGGITGTFDTSREDDMVRSCSILTIRPK